MPPFGLELRDRAHWQQAIGQCAQCRDVVGHHRGADAKTQGEYPGNANDIGNQDHNPAIADVALEIAGHVVQLAQPAEALLHEYDMSGIRGDGRRAAQRNRDIGLFQCDRIIDAIADKADLAAFPLQFLDVIGLVCRQYLGKVAIHPELLGELAGRRLMVAGDDRDVLDAALTQAADDAADFGTYRRPQLECAAQLVVDGDHHHRVAFAVRLIERRLDLSGQRHTLRLREAAAADAHSMHAIETIGDADGDAVTDLELGRVGGWQAQPLLGCLLQDRQRNRVVELPLRRGREAQDLPWTKAVGANYPPDFGPIAGQGAGLVEQHRIDLRQQIERPPVLDQDAPLRAERQCR